MVKLMLQIGQDAQTNKLLIYSYLCILSWNITSMGMTRQNRDQVISTIDNPVSPVRNQELHLRSV